MVFLRFFPAATGDQAQATCNWPDGSGLPVLLSEAPSAPPGNRSVRPSTLAQRQKVQRLGLRSGLRTLQQVKKDINYIPGHPDQGLLFIAP